MPTMRPNFRRSRPFNNPDEDVTRVRDVLSGADGFQYDPDTEQLEPMDKYSKGDAEWLAIPETLYGDYVGNGALGRSNSRVILDKFEDTEEVTEYDYGSYGTRVVLARADSTNPELIEVLRGLQDYPVVDESDWCELEWQEQQEAWDDYLKRDFSRGIVKILEDLSENEEADPSMYDDVDPYVDSLSDEELYEMFRDASDEANEYWQQEGDSQYINLERVLEGIDEVALWQAFDEWHHKHGAGSTKVQNPRYRRRGLSRSR